MGPKPAEAPQGGDEAGLLDEERRLVERAQRGDLEALRPIFERHADQLYASVILPRIGNTATAEDVLRDTFHTAIEKIDAFRWQGRSVYAWLRQIAVNKAYDVHRRTARASRLTDALASELRGETEPEQRADLRLIEEEERRINRERIGAALEALSPRYREAIELRLVSELPREECARKMNVNLGTFDVLLHRAVRAFRKQFGSRD